MANLLALSELLLVSKHIEGLRLPIATFRNQRFTKDDSIEKSALC